MMDAWAAQVADPLVIASLRHPMLSIEVANQQTAVALDLSRIQRIVEAILRDAGIAEAQLSIALVDDATIHQLNRRYLEHDDPTDVLSFVLEREGDGSRAK